MVAEKVQPSNITFSILVKVYASAGRLDAALEIVKRMEPEFKVRGAPLPLPEREGQSLGILASRSVSKHHF